MTDNRTIELLCKLLDERGEDYTRNDFGITWSYYSDPHTATESMDGTLIVTGLTPEQAIAATLGDDDYECRMDELLCRLTNGKWSKSRSYSVDFMVSCVDEAYEDATLGNGTCEIVSSYLNDFTVKNMCWYEFEMQCGYKFTWDEKEPPKHCPNCGAKVVSA